MEANVTTTENNMEANVTTTTENNMEANVTTTENNMEANVTTTTTTTTTENNNTDILHIIEKAGEMMDEKTNTYVNDICAYYGNSVFVRKIMTLYQLDFARKEIQQSIFGDIYSKCGKLPKDCKELVELLQKMGYWPKTFGSPLSIYNRLLERKKGGTDTKWFEKDGFVQHLQKSEKVHAGYFAAILNICRNMSKEKSNFEIQQREKKHDVMKIARAILDAALRGDKDEVELLLPAFDEAKQKASDVLVEYTDAEENTIETIDRRLFQVKTRKKNSVEQLEARAEQAEAAEAAAKEAAEAAAKEAAEAKREAAEAKREAAEAAAKAAEAAAKAVEDRENLRKQNAERIVQYTQQAEKFRLLQEIMKDCPEDLNKASKKQLYEMLTRLQKAIA